MTTPNPKTQLDPQTEVRWRKAYKTFAERVAGLEVDDAKFARQMAQLAPADKCYIVVFTPRSGSSWLADVLTGTKHLGQPGEQLNGNFIRNVAQSLNARDQKGVLEMLKRRRKTPNGVYGIKVTSAHIVTFGEQEFFSVFGPGTVSFMLWRDNIVAQAISLYRMATTGRTHSDQSTNDSSAENDTPDYDGGKIRHWVRHLVELENEGLTLLDRNGHKPKSICYEEIVKSENATIAFFCEALGIDRASIPEVVKLGRGLKKIGDSWNAETEEKFRSSEGAFLKQIEGERLIKRLLGREQLAQASPG